MERTLQSPRLLDTTFQRIQRSPAQHQPGPAEAREGQLGRPDAPIRPQPSVSPGLVAFRPAWQRPEIGSHVSPSGRTGHLSNEYNLRNIGRKDV
eukprot:scaffold200168_cov37-Prasinocladus_malaysianus.AAC.1